MIDPASVLLGGVVGYVLKDSKVQLQPIRWSELLEYVQTAKPNPYEVVALEANTARDNVQYVSAGNLIVVENYHSTVPFFIRLNEPAAPQLNLARLQRIEAPFYRFFIENKAGNGRVVLKVLRGINLTPEGMPLAELAARLGSIVTFDRRGDVIWLDDFEDNIDKWYQLATGTGAAIALSTGAARNGAKSAKLTTGDAVGNGSYIARYLPYPALSKIGLEFSFALGSDIDYIWLYMRLYDGTQRHTGEIRYNAQSDTLEYTDSAGSQITLASSLDLAELDHMFHTVKLVIDYTDNTFARLILDNVEHDMTGFGLRSISDTPAPRLELAMGIVNNATGNHYAYVDDAIITQNEP